MSISTHHNILQAVAGAECRSLAPHGGRLPETHYSSTLESALAFNNSLNAIQRPGFDL